MKQCKHCGIVLSDPSGICPLCHCIVEDDRLESSEVSQEPAFPYADRQRKRMRLALHIYLYASVVAVLVLIGCKIYFGYHIWWTIFIAAALVYGYITLWFSLQKAVSHRVKLALQSVLAFLLVLLIDCLIGYRGWALNIIYPVYLAAFDIVVVILMITNRSEWQSYIFLELMTIILAAVPFVLYPFHLIWSLIPVVVVLVFAILIFVGTIIFGGRRAREELARRFHY